MKSSHFGIFALVSLSLLLTVPSAFAQVTDDNPAIDNSASNAKAAFRLMELITDAESEASALGELITNNGLNMGNGLTEYANALDAAKTLAEDGLYDEAAALLEDSEGIIDDIYTQLYAQIDSRQNERFDDFVDRATDSISFLIENAEMLQLSPEVVDELQTTYDILTSGDTEAILGATGETSDVGLTFLVHPGLDNASPTANIDEKLPPALQNLPYKIKEKFGYSTDSIGSQSSDGTGDNNGDSVFPGFGAALNNDGQGPSQTDGQGVGLAETPPGLFNIGWSPDDWYAGFAFDDFLLPFDEDFEPGAAGREKAAMKRAAGIAKGIAARDGNGPPEGTPGPPCSPPCVPPPPPGPPNPPGGPPNPPGGP